MGNIFRDETFTFGSFQQCLVIFCRRPVSENAIFRLQSRLSSRFEYYSCIITSIIEIQFEAEPIQADHAQMLQGIRNPEST